MINAEMNRSTPTNSTLLLHDAARDWLIKTKRIGWADVLSRERVSAADRLW
jgi:hypothetical protein